jgi:hypothetical protein
MIVMDKKKDSSESPEREAVYTTIVGGRPPGNGTNVGSIPRGIEVLVKKASVDAEFRQLLIEKRAKAAQEIGLALDRAEQAMLSSIPGDQLEAIINQTKVTPESRRAFLGKAASVMLAALGVAVLGCDSRGEGPGPVRGIEPDTTDTSYGIRPERLDTTTRTKGNQSDPPDGSRGVRPDRPDSIDGIRPDRPVELDSVVNQRKRNPHMRSYGIQPDKPKPDSG